MKKLLLLVCVAVLAGCAALGLEKPQSTEDQLRYGQAGVSAAYKTIADLKVAGSITVDEGIGLFKKTEAVELQLAAAETLLKGPQAGTAAGKITLALQALLLVQNELKKRQGMKASSSAPPLLAGLTFATPGA